jgi:hypothetical protein
MPIGTDRAGGVNTADISSIGAGGVPPTPAIGDLMQAFRSGFITVDELARRGFSLPVEAETQRQNLEDQRVIRPLARQAQSGALANEIQIQPRRQALVAGQTEAAIRALPTEAESAAADLQRAKAAEIATGLASPDVNTRLKTVANLSTDQILDAWTAANGAPPPERLEVADPNAASNTPKPIDEFYIERFGNFPPGSNARATLNTPEVQSAYNQYVAEVKSRPLTVFKGTPEYFNRLKQDVHDLATKQAIETARIKAIPGILEQQAKVSNEAGSKLEASVRAENSAYGTKQEIQDLRKVQSAFFKLQNVLDPNKPSTPQTDQAAIFSWMKILDPGSTVREGEYATSENARGVPDTIKNYWNKVVKGLILTPEQRIKLAQASEDVYLGQVQSAIPTIEQFVDTESRIGAAVGSVVPQQDVDLLNRVNRVKKPSAGRSSSAAGTAAAPPSAGTQRVVQNGVTFEWNGSQYVPVQ